MRRLAIAAMVLSGFPTAAPAQTTPPDSAAPSPGPLAFPPRQPYKHGYKITEAYDKFTDRTTVAMPYLWSDVDGSDHVTQYAMTPRFSYPGKSLPLSPDSLLVQLVFDTEVNADRDARTGDLDRDMPFGPPEKRQLIFLLDGRDRIDLGAGAHEGGASQGLLTANFSRNLEEKITYQVQVADFLRIANAQRVEARFGKKLFKLDKPKQREGLRDLASRMGPS